MENLYIGPFGRLLPVPENISDNPQIPWGSNPEKMSRLPIQLPPPAGAPTKLMFGSDPFNHITTPRNPARQDFVEQPLKPDNLDRTPRDQLPPVRQLLTPNSFTGVPLSPYSPQSENVGSYGPPSATSAARDAAVPPSSYHRVASYHYEYGRNPASEYRTIPYVKGQPASTTEKPAPARAAPAYPVSLERPPFDQQPYAMSAPSGSDISMNPKIPSTSAAVPFAAAAVHPAVSQSPTLSEGSQGNLISRKQNIMPRPIGQRVIPGEGVCYIYEDGSHCRTVINGEPVNASWGVTKAGKPRKRLAVACLNCREKKIKCDGANPCFQCEKFGRTCRVQLSPRGTTIVEAHPRNPRSTPDFASSRIITRKSSSPNGSLSPSTGKHSLQPSHRSNSAGILGQRASRSSGTLKDVGGGPFKRYRTSSSDVKASQHANVQDNKDSISSAQAEPLYQPQRVDDVLDQNSLFTEWRNDPFQKNQDLAMHCFELYLKHINAVVYSMFPPENFRLWISSAGGKSLEDLMLIYSILALGSVFSDRSDKLNFERYFFGIAYFAERQCSSHFSLQLVQTRLILALYYMSRDNLDIGWDFCGAAVRAAFGTELNLEPADYNHECEIYEYGLNSVGSEECHRRTFWAVYLLEKQLHSFRTTHISSINTDDIYIRLPCLNQLFEMQVDKGTPYFNNNVVDLNIAKRIPRDNVGIMGYLVEISVIWETVMVNISRGIHRPLTTYQNEYELHYSLIIRRLEEFSAHLPDFLRPNCENLSRSVREGYAGNYMMLHAFYQATFMNLNRYVLEKYLQISSIRRNVEEARRHAVELLELTDQLNGCIDGLSERDYGSAFSCQFTSYAIFIACDIITAGSPMDELKRLFPLMKNNAAMLFRGIAVYWGPTQRLRARLDQRLEKLRSILSMHTECAQPRVRPAGETRAEEEPSSSTNTSDAKGMKAIAALASMDNQDPLGHEVIYALPKEVLLETSGFGPAEDWEGKVIAM